MPVLPKHKNVRVCRNYFGKGRYYLENYDAKKRDAVFLGWLNSLDEAREWVRAKRAKWHHLLLEAEK